jgi:catechol O-methyltransferase
MSNDPFDVFATDSDGDDGNTNRDKETSLPRDQQVSIIRPQIQREADNGVLAFHSGTEQALLVYVQQQLQQQSKSYDSKPARRRIVLDLVDQFCLERHWMMHVGPQKGVIVQEFLQRHFQQQHGGQLSLVDGSVGMDANENKNEGPFIIVELGTYCGYSTIRMADALISLLEREGSAETQSEAPISTPPFHIFSVDVNPQSQGIARRLLQAAGVSEFVTFVQLPLSSPSDMPLSRELEKAFQSNASNSSGSPKIDFLFVDHEKNLYLSDVQQLEASGWIRAGTAVAADNVVFFELDTYRAFMAHRQSSGIVTTELISDGIQLEYADSPLPNGDPAGTTLENNRRGVTEVQAEWKDGLGTLYVVVTLLQGHAKSLCSCRFRVDGVFTKPSKMSSMPSQRSYSLYSGCDLGFPVPAATSKSSLEPMNWCLLRITQRWRHAKQ